MSEANTYSTSSANQGVKRGLPETGLPVAEEAAGKLWGVARRGTASPEAFARQFGDKAKASGGAWAARMAILRGFKLVRSEGDKLGLSDLGLQLVKTSEPLGQIAARRTAVLNLKAYRELVEAFDATVLPDLTALASKLQFEYGKREAFAKRAAQAFVDSLHHAQMIDEHNIVHEGGVAEHASAVSLVPTPQLINIPESEEDQTQAVEIDRAFGERELESDTDEVDAVTWQSSSSDSNVSLSVTLDLSNFQADEVIRILGALGFGGHG